MFRELFDLTNRVALVTGGTRGLGLVAAEMLAAAGAKVAVCSRNAVEARRTAARIQKSTGRKCLGIAADVSVELQVKKMVQAIENYLGPVDILLAAAGINIRKPSQDLTAADWDAVMNINARGAFLCAQAVMPGMRRRKWGRIILFGSMLSFVSIPGRAAYASSKAALLGLARTLALESAPDGVCVNAVCPGPFLTPMNTAVTKDEAANRAFLQKLPVGRWGDPAELRGLLLYLSSPACSFMTGSSVVIDGGWTAQ
ncbi:MAG: 2-deoxy-D-gluconate 3-dehydrogenase [Verrucomicrobia bacterium]|nr:2-deoxy-D-gluconate 3-dehydrogenase [Verrucomicrobiota bacterium]